mmetsp:Transcript_64793/g.141145  ORF Transcript_64793/g.141145 Transcript_64793/m.141145 type:complete len:226 (+) Transcript_64793:745-1422(+)
MVQPIGSANHDIALLEQLQEWSGVDVFHIVVGREQEEVASLRALEGGQILNRLLHFGHPCPMVLIVVALAVLPGGQTGSQERHADDMQLGVRGRHGALGMLSQAVEQPDLRHVLRDVWQHVHVPVIDAVLHSHQLEVALHRFIEVEGARLMKEEGGEICLAASAPQWRVGAGNVALDLQRALHGAAHLCQRNLLRLGRVDAGRFEHCRRRQARAEFSPRRRRLLR